MHLPIEPRRVALQMLPKSGEGVEIGVHTGSFSRQLLRICRPTKLHLVDPWAYQAHDKHAMSHYGRNNSSETAMEERYQSVLVRFQKEINAGQVEVHRAFSADAAAAFVPGSLDFVYIDGDHNYAGVVADLANYGPLVKSGGLIVADDYELTSWWQGGVVRAVNEFIGANSVEIAFKLGNQVGIRILD